VPRERRRTAGLVLVGICVVLLPIAGALGSVWLAVPLAILGPLGMGLLISVLVEPKD
jgi:hypothetical protein